MCSCPYSFKSTRESTLFLMTTCFVQGCIGLIDDYDWSQLEKQALTGFSSSDKTQTCLQKYFQSNVREAPLKLFPLSFRHCPFRGAGFKDLTGWWGVDRSQSLFYFVFRDSHSQAGSTSWGLLFRE